MNFRSSFIDLTSQTTLFLDVIPYEIKWASCFSGRINMLTSNEL